jgi:tetratricopeptide (TPR) repeat protein
VALIAEEVLGDFARATAAYEEILALEPDRIGAILGLARTAARKGDDKALYRALLDEARVTRNDPEALSLRTRAASAIAKTDSARALALVTDVLRADPAHAAARAVLTRVHEEARRWELVAQSLEAQLEHATQNERLPLFLYLAEIQEAHLKAPIAALATLRRARLDYPKDARILPSIARVLSAVKEPGPLREAYETLAREAPGDEERASYLVLAAEIDEHRLGDDVSATRFYEEALAATPGDDLISERLERLLARRKGDGPTRPFDRAMYLVETDQDLALATTVLETVTEREVDHVPALRLLEGIHFGPRVTRYRNIRL